MDYVAYLLSKPGASEDYPFGDGVTVFKVKGKMFALASPAAKPVSLNLKCDPKLAIHLRQTYPEAVIPGYHMNKTHWNTVTLDGRVPEDEVARMIDHSYELIAGKK